ncbi:MAG: winged helix-turn-helix domain-containing protein [Anaerolineales bacterium]|nr:winged helix-turn-helix domain-containing protein [Anaerolineales bacterium]
MTDETSESPVAELAAIPTYDTLFIVVLEALRAHAGQATNDQIAAYVIAALGLPSRVVEVKHQPGRALRRLEYNLQWTRTYLRRYGLIDSPRRAVWLLTAAGWQREAIDAHDIVRAVRCQMSAARLAREGQAPIFDAESQ